MFYVIYNNELALFADDRELLNNTLMFEPHLNDCDVLETNIVTAFEITNSPDKVIVEDGALVINPDWAQEQAEKEHARIQALSMTRSDFFDNTIKAFGMNEADFKPIVENILTVLGVDNIARKIALNNYDNALNFYRKHTIFTLLSGVEIPLGETLKVKIEAEQWDRFFDQVDKRNEEAYKILQEGIEEVSNSEE